MHVGWGRPIREGFGSVERWRPVARGVRRQRRGWRCRLPGSGGIPPEPPGEFRVWEHDLREPTRNHYLGGHILCKLWGLGWRSRYLGHSLKFRGQFVWRLCQKLRDSLEMISIWGHILEELTYEGLEMEILSEGFPSLLPWGQNSEERNICTHSATEN